MREAFDRHCGTFADLFDVSTVAEPTTILLLGTGLAGLGGHWLEAQPLEVVAVQGGQR